jgi:uroporphyrinogen-III decarboxylase
MDPDTPARQEAMDRYLPEAVAKAKQGMFVIQKIVGGYMYLRSLIGPEELLYIFYDEPELIHDCMQSWLTLSDKVIAMHQETVQIDELFIAEDICYNTSSLISPDMIKEFLFPYYQQLIANVRSRQKRKDIFLQVDTDGRIDAVLDLYKSVGFNYFSPFEVAAGSDVVAARKAHPDILIRGGFDKRILAAGKDAIDREVDRIMPFMKEHGGFIPTCDHGVPEEVEFEDYLYFRKRLLEFAW